tara:strand:+ start:499 stop:1077 length:579 start_codon:yes stop_codon:yes gene_type:complete
MKAKKVFRRKVPFYKKKEFMTYLVGLFIIVIMATSALSMWGGDEEGVEFDGMKFVDSGYGWQTYIGESKVTISSYPLDLENVSIDDVSFSSLNLMGKLYFSINPYDSYQQAVYDFQANIDLFPNVVYSCYEDNDLCSDMPLKDCDDAMDGTGVVIFRETNSSDFVEFSGNCLVIEGKDLLKVTDKLILDYYG